jgi:hypothetical protein
LDQQQRKGCHTILGSSLEARFHHLLLFSALVKLGNPPSGQKLRLRTVLAPEDSHTNDRGRKNNGLWSRNQ